MARNTASVGFVESSLRKLFPRWWKQPEWKRAELKHASRRTRRQSFLEPLERRAVMASDLGAISGIVFVDTTGDGYQLGEEVANATVRLFQDDGDGIFEPGVDDTLLTSTTTDANGEYLFGELPIGDYWVEQIAQVVSPYTLAQDVIAVEITDDAGTPGTLIDDFDTPAPQVVAADPVNSTDSDTADIPTSETIGGERDLFVELTATGGADNVELTVSGNVLTINPTVAAQGQYIVTWDGDDDDGATTDFTGLGGVDLTDSGNSHGIVLENTLFDQAGGSVTLRVYTSATDFSELEINVPDSTTTDLFFNFDDFTVAGGTGADFVNVGAIQLIVDSTINGMDGSIDFIRAIGYSIVDIDFDNYVESDLELEKTVDNDTPNVGDDITFTITVTNQGPDSAMNVVVEDLLPAGLTFVSFTASQGAYVSGTGLWTVGSITTGATATLDIVATVTTIGAKTNLAEIVASDSVDIDSTPDNSGTIPGEDDTDSVVVTPQQVDLSLTKTADDTTVSVGEDVTFTITVANAASQDDATGVEVTDLLPAGFTFVSATESQGTYTAGTGIWDVGTIASGSNATLVIVATKNAVGPVINTAEITAVDQADIDSTPGNFGTTPGEDDGDSETVNDPNIDLAVTKTVNNQTPNVGQQVTFTITVSNSGAGNATGVEVTDLLPAGLTFVSATESQGTYTAGTGVWDVGAINTGSNATLQIVATVATAGAKTNIAQVTAADQTDSDSTPGNYATTPGEDDGDSETVTPPSIDLSVDKSVNNATPNIGQQVTFTIVVSNAAGQSNATGVQLTDQLPAGLTFVSANASQGAYVSGTGIWTIGNINAGANATLTIVATVTTVGAKTNAAEITAADQADIDSTPGNAAAEDDRDTAVVTPPQIDLSLTKTVNGGATATANKNQNVTYVITVSNAAGQSNATGVQVTDLLPAGMTFVSANASQGSYVSGTGVWTVGTINTGASATLTVVATVTTSTQKVNTAAVTAADQGDIDSTPGNQATTPNEDDTASATVNPNVADLSVTKTVDNATPNKNQNVTFTVTLANGGPATATNVTVLDLLPTGFTFVSANATSGTYTAATGQWVVASLNSAANATLTIVATPTSAGAKVNTAAVTASDQFDNDSTPGNQATTPNEDDTASATVTPVATDLNVTKTVDDDSPDQGDNITFTITVNNTSAVNATNVVLTDLLPAGLAFVSANASQGSYVAGTGLWTIGTVNANSSVTLTVVATVTNKATKVNTAQITSLDQFDSDSTPGNSVAGEDDQASVTIEPFLLSKRLCVVR
jgi:uncharacterized repeat protein (TIGR01451 family)